MSELTENRGQIQRGQHALRRRDFNERNIQQEGKVRFEKVETV